MLLYFLYMFYDLFIQFYTIFLCVCALSGAKFDRLINAIPRLEAGEKCILFIYSGILVRQYSGSEKE